MSKSTYYRIKEKIEKKGFTFWRIRWGTYKFDSVAFRKPQAKMIMQAHHFPALHLLEFDEL